MLLTILLTLFTYMLCDGNNSIRCSSAHLFPTLRSVMSQFHDVTLTETEYLVEIDTP